MEGELGTIASHLLSAFGVYMLMLIRLWGCKAPHPRGGNPGSGGILVQPFLLLVVEGEVAPSSLRREEGLIVLSSCPAGAHYYPLLWYPWNHVCSSGHDHTPSDLHRLSCLRVFFLS